MADKNPTAKTTGWWLWKKTVVEHAGGSSTFDGDAQVTESAGSLCVREAGVFTDKTTCFLKPSAAARAELPDGELAGRSKAVEVTLVSGEVKSFPSSIFGVYSADKQGGEVVVKKAGLFGERVVERIAADQVAAVKAENCKVCEQINPLFKQ